MAAENWDPLFVISQQKQEVNAYSGVMSKVLNYLQSNLNFSTTVVRPPDGSWGVIDEETGDWGGMVGMVLRNETDFGLGNLLRYPKRHQINATHFIHHAMHSL